MGETTKIDLGNPEGDALFVALANAVPNHLWMCTHDGNIYWFNSALQDYTGFNSKRLSDEGWLATIHPDDLVEVQAKMSRALITGEIHTSIFRLRRHDGVFRWYLARATPIRGADGKLERWLGSNTDIHDQKMAEEEVARLAASLESQVTERTAELMKTQDALRQSQKMETVGNLAGGVAHDFNNILQIVMGSIQLIRRNVDLDDTTRRRVDGVEEAVRRGARIASQLLGFSRKSPVQPEVINPLQTIEQIVSLLSRALGSGIQLRIQGPEDPWNIHVDRTNFENAVLNLAINARDAMEHHGSFSVTVLNQKSADSEISLPEGDYVVIRATDTGTGMSAEIAERVFEPFFTTKPVGKGTGLGLAMVHGFVTQSLGTVRVLSEPGQGATFELWLPRTMLDERELLVPAPLADSAPRSGGIVLLVEDDLAVRDTTAAMLLDLGYRVVTARHAQDAFERLTSGLKVDLMLTDVIMPGPMTSVELVQKVGEIMPDLPVLYTSGFAENLVVHGGRVDEGVELIFKPFGRDELADRIDKLLKKAEGRETAAS